MSGDNAKPSGGVVPGRSLLGAPAISSPFKTVLIVIATVFLAEALVMILMNRFVDTLSPRLTMVLDSLLLTLFVLPVLYCVLWKPLIHDIGVRKETERVLSRSEEQYRLLFDRNPLPMWVYDQETLAFLAVNDAAVDHYGYSRAEFLSMTIKDIRPPEDVPVLENYVTQVIRGGLKHSGVWRHRKKDGSLTLAEIHSHCVELKGREARLVLVHDITEEREAKSRLIESEERFRSTFEQAAVGIAHADLNGQFLKVNRKFCDIVGYSQDELLRLKFHEITHPEDLKTDLDHLRELVSGTTQTFSMEKRYYRKDGSLVWVELTGSAVRTADGVIKYLIGVVEDISKRKVVEHQVLKAKEEWELTFDAVPDLIMIVDSRHRIVRLNRAMAARLGREPRDCIGLRCYEHVHGTTEPPPFCPHTKLLQDGKDHVDEIHEERLGGDFLVTASPVYNAEGRLTGSVHVARDITERKRAEQERKRLDDQFNRLQQIELIEKIAAGVAHEVRNPLHAIMSLTEALQKKLGPSEQYRPFLTHMKSQVDQLSSVMRDLLDLGKPIEPGNMQRINLYDVCGLAIDLWKDSPLSATHRVRIADSAGTAPPEVYGESRRLQQVLFNLFDNAAHHSPEGKSIQVRVLPSARGCVMVEVTDEGSGIAEDLLPRIFEPFFTTRKKGTGLGLSIVKTIVESHGGSVVVGNNKPEPGCTVTITLPMVA